MFSAITFLLIAVESWNYCTATNCCTPLAHLITCMTLVLYWLANLDNCRFHRRPVQNSNNLPVMWFTRKRWAGTPIGVIAIYRFLEWVEHYANPIFIYFHQDTSWIIHYTFSCFLFQAFLKLGMMLMINWRYALTFIGTGFVIWVYVGLTNPAVKPGAASEFNFLLWLKSALLRFCGWVLQVFQLPPIASICWFVLAWNTVKQA